MECIYCGVDVPDVGFYCPDCLLQIRCKNCSEQLVAKANGCIFCGTKLSDSTAPGREPSAALQNAPNRIVLQETTKSRSIEASFTDQTASALVGLWQGSSKPFAGLASRTTPIKINHGEMQTVLPLGPSDIVEEPASEPNDFVKESASAPSEATTKQEILSRICRWSDDKLIFRDTNLKGTSNKDWRTRATLIALLYMQEIEGIHDVEKSVLVSAVDSLGLFDNNYYADLKDRTWLTVDGEDRFSLTISGERQAWEYVNDVADPLKERSDVPKIGKRRKSATPNPDKASQDSGIQSSAAQTSTKSTTSSSRGVEAMLKKWDANPLRADYRSVKWSDLERLDQVVLSLHAVHAVEESRDSVSRNLISDFLEAAFGVPLSGRSIADIAKSSAGRMVISYERRKGYSLREDGLEKARSLLREDH